MPSGHGSYRNPRHARRFRYAVLAYGKRSLRRYALLPNWHLPKHGRNKEFRYQRPIVVEAKREFGLVGKCKARQRRVVRGVSGKMRKILGRLFAGSGHLEPVVVRLEKIKLGLSDLQCLGDGCWLNDEVVNAYVQLLRRDAAEKKSKNYFHTTFFFTKLVENGKYCYENVRRWTSRGAGKCQLMEQQRVLFPINTSNEHWSLAVAFIQKRTVVYYDSLAVPGSSVLKYIMRYLKDEAKEKTGQALDSSKWSMVDM